MTDRKTDPEAWEREQEGRQGPVVRDKRRIDPKTGAVREPAKGSAPVGSAASSAKAKTKAKSEAGADEVESLRAQLAERTNDLQRVQAEYANYRKRMDRDRQLVREQALANVLTDLLPVLDDIDRAREHGELTGGFQKIAEAFEQIVSKLGLTRFGEKGEPFDPTVHEALMHSYSTEVTEPTCVEVLQPGYAVASRLLRPARVAVAEPAPPPEQEPAPEEEPAATEQAGQDPLDQREENEGQ